MNTKDYTRRRFRDGIPAWFLIACVSNYNFKSFRRFIIYLLHYSCALDLTVRKASSFCNEELIELMSPIIAEKLPKAILRQFTGLSPNTFNDKFAPYFEENNLVGRKSFTLLETYNIFNFWQGDGDWGRLQAVKKKTIADILQKGNYERTALEFKGAIGEEEYRDNLVSPKKIKALIEHIDLTDEEQEKEALIGYKDFQEDILWTFCIIMGAHYVARFFDTNNSNSAKPLALNQNDL